MLTFIPPSDAVVRAGLPLSRRGEEPPLEGRSAYDAQLLDLKSDALGRTDRPCPSPPRSNVAVERQLSISMSLEHTEWQDRKVNLIDVPGDPAFQGELRRAARVVEEALVTVIRSPSHSADDVDLPPAEGANDDVAARGCQDATAGARLFTRRGRIHCDSSEAPSTQTSTTIAPLSQPCSPCSSAAALDRRRKACAACRSIVSNPSVNDP